MHNPSATEMEVADAKYELERCKNKTEIKLLLGWDFAVDLWSKRLIDDRKMFSLAKEARQLAAKLR